MLLVKTYLDKSPIHGIGLFAAEDIPIGEKIATYDLQFNPIIKISPTLSKQALLFVKKYGVNRDGFMWYRMYLDDERFMNHSDDPNTIQIGMDVCIAKVLIKEGEEITCNYNQLK